MNWKLIRQIDRFIGIPLVWLCRLFVSTKRRQTGVPPKRILLIKFWGIGNLFMLLPSIQALRATWPDAAIDFLTLENNRDAMAMTGCVNNIHSIDTSSPVKFFNSWWRAITTLNNNNYQLVIDFEQFARFSALITFRIAAGRSIGFATRGQGRHQLYTNPVSYDNDIHITRSFYQLVEQAGITRPFSPDIHLGCLDAIRHNGLVLLRKHQIPLETPLVVMHIGTSDNFCERRWPPQRYSELSDLLTQNYGMQVILTGLPDETHLLKETARHLKHKEPVSNLGGKLTFTEYFELIAVAKLVISADTAAVHIASTLNIPVIGLYGPNSPHLYGPWGNNGLALYASFSCSPCITNFNSKINICRHPDGRGACMLALTVTDVFTALQKNYSFTDGTFKLLKAAHT